ncbi:MAG: 30S ribosomal protein S21, partial [Dehalococcoidia bacterium]|nr:30S ribosomal protein S21 [Dehalococcoidia bacterium]
MPEVRLGEGESFESLLRRFTRKVQQEGIIS